MEASVPICRNAKDGDVRNVSKPFRIDKIDLYVSNAKTNSKILILTDVILKRVVVPAIVLVTPVLLRMLVGGKL